MKLIDKDLGSAADVNAGDYKSPKALLKIILSGAVLWLIFLAIVFFTTEMNEPSNTVEQTENEVEVESF